MKGRGEFSLTNISVVRILFIDRRGGANAYPEKHWDLCPWRYHRGGNKVMDGHQIEGP